MKCPKCGGNAELSNWGSLFDPDYADFHVECERCGYHSMGSTDPQKAKEMFEKETGMYYTNGQWLRQANTEQLAEFLIASIKKCKSCASGIGFDEVQHCPFGECGCHFKGEVVAWLKQPHTDKE